MKTNLKPKQKGFTLVEIAIVLVIIGLLLGGVLKGQELIRSAKIKGEASQIDGYKAGYFGYIDRYGYKPGDDPTQATRWTDMTNGGGNGDINGGTCSSDTDESCLAMRALYHSGFIKGDGTVKQPKPLDKLGGKVHLFTGTYYGQRGVWLYHEGYVDKDILTELDKKIDDGKCNSGAMTSWTTNNAYCDQTTGAYKRNGYFVTKID